MHIARTHTQTQSTFGLNQVKRYDTVAVANAKSQHIRFTLRLATPLFFFCYSSLKWESRYFANEQKQKEMQ